MHNDLLPFLQPPAPPTADDAEPRPRVIPFPTPSTDRCRIMAVAIEQASAILGDDLNAIIDVATELLLIDDNVFALRLRDLRQDEAGRGLLAEVLAGIQSGLAGLDQISRGLFVVRARLTAGHRRGRLSCRLT